MRLFSSTLMLLATFVAASMAAPYSPGNLNHVARTVSSSNATGPATPTGVSSSTSTSHEAQTTSTTFLSSTSSSSTSQTPTPCATPLPSSSITSYTCSATGLPNRNDIVRFASNVPGSTSADDCALACYNNPICFSFGAVYNKTTPTAPAPAAANGTVGIFNNCDLYFDLGDQLDIESPGTADQVEVFWDLRCWGLGTCS